MAAPGHQTQRRSPSVPIAIAQPYIDTPSSSDDEDENENGDFGLGGLTVGSLTVGSMPASRHGRRGGRESSGGFSGSRSLPPPRAPFLSARENPRDSLSSMPLMTLPETAFSPPDGSDLSASVPYGSLRDCRFQRRYRAQRQRGAGKHVRFSGDSPGSGIGGISPGSGGTSDGQGDSGGLRDGLSPSSNSSAGAQTLADSAFIPHSLPTYMDADRDLVRKRWEQTASAAGGRNSPSPLSIGQMGHQESGGEGEGLNFGAGARREQCSGGPLAPSTASLLSEKLSVSSTSTPGAGGLGDALAASSSSAGIASGGGGIGSMVEKSPNLGFNSVDGDNENDTNRGDGEAGAIGSAFADDDAGADESSLGTSLTVLGILESSRNHGSVENGNAPNVAVAPPTERLEELDQQQQRMPLPPHHQPQQFQQHHAYGTPGLGNHDLHDSLNAKADDDRPDSPSNNPDTFEAFDLDLDM